MSGNWHENSTVYLFLLLPDQIPYSRGFQGFLFFTTVQKCRLDFTAPSFFGHFIPTVRVNLIKVFPVPNSIFCNIVRLATDTSKRCYGCLGQQYDIYS